jgi:hypothetical protein
MTPRYPRDLQMSSVKGDHDREGRVQESVGLLRRLSSRLSCRRQNEADSDETVGFSAPKTCVTKRLRESISDDPDAATVADIGIGFGCRSHCGKRERVCDSTPRGNLYTVDD